MITLLTAVFVASLVGSVHCAGMCGGIVTLCVSGAPVRRGGVWAPQLLYNFGRLVTYAALGAVSGAAGAAVDLGGGAIGWGPIATTAAGLAMVAVGAVALMRTAGVRIGCASLPPALRNVFQRGMTTVQRMPAGARPAAIGALTG